MVIYFLLQIFSPKGLSSSKLNNRKAEEAFSHETNENSPDNTKSLDSEDFSGTKKPSIILEKALKLSQSKSWSSPLKCVEKAETTNPLLYRQFSAKKKPVLNSKFLQQHAEQIDVHQEVVKNIRGEMEEEEEVPQDEDEKPRKKKGKKWQAKVEESGDGMDNVARDAWLELKESHLQKEEERLKNSQASLGKSNWNPLTNTDNTVVKSSLPSAFEDWEDLPPFDDEEFAASMEMEMDTEVGKELSQGDSNVNDNENTSVSSSKSKSFKLDNFMKNKNQKSVNGKAPVINTVNKTGSQVADDVNCDNEVDSHLSLKDKSRSKRKRQESEPESNETSDVTWRSDSRVRIIFPQIPTQGTPYLIREEEIKAWFNIKMPSYQYSKSHCGDKTVVRSSYLHNGISYIGKIVSFYWIMAQASAAPHCQRFNIKEARYKTLCSTSPSGCLLHVSVQNMLI